MEILWREVDYELSFKKYRQGEILEPMNFNGRIQDNIYYGYLSDFSVKVLFVVIGIFLYVFYDPVLWLVKSQGNDLEVLKFMFSYKQ